MQRRACCPSAAGAPRCLQQRLQDAPLAPGFAECIFPPPAGLSCSKITPPLGPPSCRWDVYEGRLTPAARRLPERHLITGLGEAGATEPGASHALGPEEASASLEASIEGLALSPRTPHPPADLTAIRLAADLAASQAAAWVQ